MTTQIQTQTQAPTHVHTATDGRRVSMRPVDPDADAPLLHRWLTHPRSRYWESLDHDLAQVCRTYQEMAGRPGEDAWLGLVDEQPMFLVETYDVDTSPLAGHPRLQAGDLGMHLLVAPPVRRPVPGTTDLAMAATMRWCLDHLLAPRVVVEPDVRNHAIHAKNAAAGFRTVCAVELPGKQALLAICTPESFASSRLGGRTRGGVGPLAHGVAHLTPTRAALAHRLLAAKAIGELAHEQLLRPERVGPAGSRRDLYRLATSQGAEYEFTARRMALDHWVVDADSLRRHAAAGDPCDERVDVLRLVTETADELGLDHDRLVLYLAELSSTLAARCATLDPDRPEVDALLEADLPTIEAAMTEGHPCFVATNGRIGFDVHDVQDYAPERGSTSAPLWVAAHRRGAELTTTDGWTEQSALEAVVGLDLLATLRADLQRLGHDPADYLLIPVHPWQWRHHLCSSLADDIARGDLVPLRLDPHRHRPQQSIRTWLDVDDPGRPYVKMALGIQNMGFLRGLSPAYLAAAPTINALVADVVRHDPELVSRGFDVLVEFAAVGWTGDAFHRIGRPSTHTKLLSALWRETPVPRAQPGERQMTMAALLHRDLDGRSLAAEMVRRSGLEPVAWLRRYLDAVLWPLLHLLARHHLAFMPHGENIILVVRDHVVVGAYLKDIGEEAVLFDDGRVLPARAERMRVQAPGDVQALSLLTDVLDGVLRFLSAILDEERVLPEQQFWAAASQCISEYDETHPGAADRLDLFAPTFARSCLNRLQLRDTTQMVDLTDQHGSLLFADPLDNPLRRPSA